MKQKVSPAESQLDMNNSNNLLFATSTGVLPAVPQTISQAFDLSSMHVRATLSRLTELEDSIREEGAKPRRNVGVIDFLKEQHAEAEDHLYQRERDRLAIYRAMVAASNARMTTS